MNTRPFLKRIIDHLFSEKFGILIFIAYLFVGHNIYSQDSIGIIGTAVGGWHINDIMEQDINNPNLWTLTANLVAGEAKFRKNADWTVNWGAAGFPTDTAYQDGPNIPIPAGYYRIEFDTSTRIYNFFSPRVGINTSSPRSTLDVNGQVIVGNESSAPISGAIRWNEANEDFEGYNGNQWVSLTKGSAKWGNQLSNPTEKR